MALTANQLLKIENFIHWSNTNSCIKDGSKQELIDAYESVLTPENEKQLNALLDLVFEHGRYGGSFDEAWEG
jgi:hypothetical protein